MIQPRLSSVIERRLLVNYRVTPDAAARLLPAGLRPQLVRGHAVAGICLLRLGSARPTWAPSPVGLRSENAAHRISVEWDGPDGVETGVYITRRDTGSRINSWAGGRVFPGEHGRADFTVHETPDEVRVALATRDGEIRVDVTAEVTDELRGSELFTDLQEASDFFRAGARACRRRLRAAASTPWSWKRTRGRWQPGGSEPRGRPSSTTRTASRPAPRPWTASWSCATSPPAGARYRRGPWPVADEQWPPARRAPRHRRSAPRWRPVSARLRPLGEPAPAAHLAPASWHRPVSSEPPKKRVPFEVNAMMAP